MCEYIYMYIYNVYIHLHIIVIWPYWINSFASQEEVLQTVSSVHKDEAEKIPSIHSVKVSQQPVPRPLLEPEQCSQLGIWSLHFLAPAGVDYGQEETVLGNPATLASEDQRYMLGAEMSVFSASQSPTKGCCWAEPEGPGCWQVQRSSLGHSVWGHRLWC